MLKKKFYGVANRSYNEWNGMYPTLEEAQAEVQRRREAGCRDSVEVQIRELTKEDLDGCLEGEGTEQIWEEAN